MDLPKITGVDIEDIFADINLEIDEVESVIKIICCALENSKYNQDDIKDIDSALFMLQGKINAVKNNFRIIKEILNK